jgi:hypothetical protein
MSGMDTLIAKSLQTIIKENLGDKTYEKMENRLFERHGMGFTQAAYDFKKVDSVFREFFGAGAEGIEKQILEKIVILEGAQKSEKKWVTLEDSRLVELILKSLGDEDKKSILNSVMADSRIISDILETCNIPQTSGYRKVNSLIQEGILVPHGFVETSDGKRVTKYKSVFDNISIEIEKNKVVVKVEPTLESMKESHMMQIICS